MSYYIDTERIFYPVETKGFPLIHITQKWELLELILKEGLKPSYCKEFISNGIDTKYACFPMISTSNVSMDFAINFLRSYGTLGIILDKKWGENNDFNPVLYLEKKSDITNEIIQKFNNIKAKSIENIINALDGLTLDDKSLMIKLLVKIFAHSKNYDGILIRNGKIISDKYSYGREHEWRKIIKHKDAPYFLVDCDDEKKMECNKLINHIRVDYSLDDLKGVIVETDWQIELVKKIVCDKYNLSEFPSGIHIQKNTLRHLFDEG